MAERKWIQGAMKVGLLGMWVFFVCLLGLLAVQCGCISTTSAYKLARLQNSYDYWESQYEDRCVTVSAPAPAGCRAVRDALRVMKRDLDRAVWITGPDGKRIPRPEPIPLQLGLCKGDEAVLVKAFRAVK